MNWALYNWLHNALHLRRTYCYYDAIRNKKRAVSFFKRFTTKPTMTNPV